MAKDSLIFSGGGVVSSSAVEVAKHSRINMNGLNFVSPWEQIGDGGVQQDILAYCAVGNFIYHHRSGQMWKYNTVTEVDTQIGAIGLDSTRHGMVAIGTDIFIHSGFVAGAESNRIFKFDTITETAIEVASAPTSRRDFAVCAIGTKMYVHGGYPATGAMEVYDTVADTWTTLATSTARYRHAVVPMQNGTKILIDGGLDTPTSTIYDIAGDSYSTDSAGTGMLDHIGVEYNGNCFFHGSSLQKYFPNYGVFKSVDIGASAKAYHLGVVIADSLFVGLGYPLNSQYYKYSFANDMEQKFFFVKDV